MYFGNLISYTLFFLIAVLLLGCDAEQATNPESHIAVGTRLVALPVNKDNQILLPDSGLYQGDYLNKAFHGNGQLVWRNGNIYTGEFYKGLMQGQGKMKLNMGDIYIGGFKEGEWSGYGQIKYAVGDRYAGQFKHSMFNGKGRYEYANGDVFVGEFKNNRANGNVTINYHNKATYTGDVKNWKMDGKGIYTSKRGTIYSGQFVNDAQQGQGTVKFVSGATYAGEIKDWFGNGQGLYISKNGNRYEGYFVDGEYNGKGILKYKNGNVYRGDFKDGMFNGKGTFTRAKPNGRKKQLKGWWQYGKYAGLNKPKKLASKKKIKKKRLNAEKIYYSQAELLKESLSKLKPSIANKPDLYMISFASYGYQDVFMKEAQFSTRLFNKKLGTKGRSLMLINNPKLAATTPLASVTNLQRSLKYIGNIMDKDEDILFLFLTSHGSKKHVLSVSLRGVPLNNLPAKKLASMLKNSGIKWKVIVVSSCYSGGFIDALKDQNTLIMTAAKSDHVSFGCSNDADFTYFGRALFEKSIPTERTFIQAFAKAKKFITQWENKDKYDHSQPQLWTTKKIENQLSSWRKNLRINYTSSTVLSRSQVIRAFSSTSINTN